MGLFARLLTENHENDSDLQHHETHHVNDGTGIKGHLTTTHEDSHILRHLKDGHSARIRASHKDSKTGKGVRSKFTAQRRGDDIHLTHEDHIQYASIKHSAIKHGPEKPSRDPHYMKITDHGTLEHDPEKLHNTWD